MIDPAFDVRNFGGAFLPWRETEIVADRGARHVEPKQEAALTQGPQVIRRGVFWEVVGGELGALQAEFGAVVNEVFQRQSLVGVLGL